MSEKKRLVRNVALGISVVLGSGEAMEVSVPIPYLCRTKSLHIPGQDAPALMLKEVRHLGYRNVRPVGCSVFGGFSEIDPFRGRLMPEGSTAYLTFENRYASPVGLYGALVVEAEVEEDEDGVRPLGRAALEDILQARSSD